MLIRCIGVRNIYIQLRFAERNFIRIKNEVVVVSGQPKLTQYREPANITSKQKLPKTYRFWAVFV